MEMRSRGTNGKSSSRSSLGSQRPLFCFVFLLMSLHTYNVCEASRLRVESSNDPTSVGGGGTLQPENLLSPVAASSEILDAVVTSLDLPNLQRIQHELSAKYSDGKYNFDIQYNGPEDVLLVVSRVDPEDVSLAREEKSVGLDDNPFSANVLGDDSNIPPSIRDIILNEHGDLPSGQLLEQVTSISFPLMMAGGGPNSVFTEETPGTPYPILGGITTSLIDITDDEPYGTLGGFVVDKTDNTAYGVTNAHVLRLTYDGAKRVYKPRTACVPAYAEVKHQYPIPPSPPYDGKDTSYCTAYTMDDLNRIIEFDDGDEEKNVPGRCVDQDRPINPPDPAKTLPDFESRPTCTKANEATTCAATIPEDTCDDVFFQKIVSKGAIPGQHISHCCFPLGRVAHNAWVYHGGQGNAVQSAQVSADGVTPASVQTWDAKGTRPPLVDIAVVPASRANYDVQPLCDADLKRKKNTRRPFQCASLGIGPVSGQFDRDLIADAVLRQLPKTRLKVLKTGGRTFRTTGVVIGEEIVSGFYSKMRNEQPNPILFRKYTIRGDGFPTFDPTGLSFMGGPHEEWIWKRPIQQHANMPPGIMAPAKEPKIYEDAIKRLIKEIADKFTTQVNSWDPATRSANMLKIFTDLHAQGRISVFALPGDSGSFVLLDRGAYESDAAVGTGPFDVLGLLAWGKYVVLDCLASDAATDGVTIAHADGDVRICGLEIRGIVMGIDSVLEILRRDAMNGMIGDEEKAKKKVAFEPHPGFKVCIEDERVKQTSTPPPPAVRRTPATNNAANSALDNLLGSIVDDKLGKCREYLTIDQDLSQVPLGGRQAAVGHLQGDANP